MCVDSSGDLFEHLSGERSDSWRGWMEVDDVNVVVNDLPQHFVHLDWRVTHRKI